MLPQEILKIKTRAFHVLHMAAARCSGMEVHRYVFTPLVDTSIHTRTSLRWLLERVVPRLDDVAVLIWLLYLQGPYTRLGFDCLCTRLWCMLRLSHF